MAKSIEVRFKGLNELGVKELNEFYKINIKKNYIQPWELGSNDKVNFKKRYKQPKSFYKLGLDTCVRTVDLVQSREENKQYGYSCYFKLQLKHYYHEIYEVEVIETFKQITL
jgi:hypothetical protein